MTQEITNFLLIVALMLTVAEMMRVWMIHCDRMWYDPGDPKEEDE